VLGGGNLAGELSESELGGGLQAAVFAFGSLPHRIPADQKFLASHQKR